MIIIEILVMLFLFQFIASTFALILSKLIKAPFPSEKDYCILIIPVIGIIYALTKLSDL